MAQRKKYPSILTAVNASVRAAGELQEQDKALVQICRVMAQNLDEVLATDADVEVHTKALFAVPNLVKALGELGCTPAARTRIKEQMAKIQTMVPEKSAPMSGSDRLKSMTRGNLKAVK